VWVCDEAETPLPRPRKRRRDLRLGASPAGARERRGARRKKKERESEIGSWPGTLPISTLKSAEIKFDHGERQQAAGDRQPGVAGRARNENEK
jgi:hypothetical protein